MRVAVFGAGYAGLTVARRLERHTDADLVVVDDSGTHLLQHELHRLLRYPDLADAITLPLGDLLDAALRQARVTAVDPEAREAVLEPVDGDETETLAYDVGVVCLGAETAFHALPGVKAHATPLKRPEDARAIRRVALNSPDGHAVVGGAGLSGVQVAGELAALSSAADLDLAVTVVEQGDAVAPGFDPAFQRALRRELLARDVTVETGVAVERADDAAVHLADGRTLSQDCFVWTGGIRGPDALEGERWPVGPDLRVAEGTYVVGDAGVVEDADGTPVPASAQTAVRQARVAAAGVARDLAADGHPDHDRPTDDGETLGWVVSVGDGAVAQVGPAVFSGDAARAAKAVVGAGHLASVGAVGEAADLVAEELGWPTSDTVSCADLPLSAVTSDPGTVSALGSSVGKLGVATLDAAVPGDSLDLAAATRLTDRAHPGSPANVLGRALSAPLAALRDEN